MEELSLEEVKQKAEEGDAQAQYQWAMCYFDGNGVEQDEKKAVEWLEKAVAQGNGEARYALAICYESGMGVDPDPVKAAELYA